jgi:hypothetical protein
LNFTLVSSPVRRIASRTKELRSDEGTDQPLKANIVEDEPLLAMDLEATVPSRDKSVIMTGSPAQIPSDYAGAIGAIAKPWSPQALEQVASFVRRHWARRSKSVRNRSLVGAHGALVSRQQAASRTACAA